MCIARILFQPALLIAAITCATVNASDEDPVFSRDVLPILSENCFQCHGPDEGQRQADLRLDEEADAESVLGRPSGTDSELLRRIDSQDPDELMPPASSNLTLTSSEKNILRRWLKQGSPWGKHWSFESLQSPPVPTVEFAGIPRHNPIDNLVQTQLKGTALVPSPETSRLTLLRRVTLDLTGLPPTIEEQDAFVQDTSPQAYERVVDRLLESPRYGERMAWDWLNAARYADSNGYQGDRDRTMWPWREWVVNAFNENMPFDEFTIHQLAGDLLPDATFEQKLATGFCRNHMINGEGGRIPEENRVDYVMDMTETMGTVWLGLTLNCCRCHDHKFDPLRQQDYYQFFAFFNQTPVNGGGGDPQMAPNLAAPSESQARELADLESRLTELKKQLDQRAGVIAPGQPDWEVSALAAEETSPNKEALAEALKTAVADRTDKHHDIIRETYRQTDSEYAAVSQRLGELRKNRDETMKRVPKVMIMQDRDDYRTTKILTRGLYNSPTKREVEPATPLSLPDSFTGRGHNRLDLARWLMSDSNPLTARVTVNRFWQQIFGMGLVKTTEDFGVQSEYPVQRELLDWLAFDFRTNGWNVKRLIRQIVLSHTYRQSSAIRTVTSSAGDQVPELEIDPDNRLLARSSRYRWPSFVLRDQALASCGLLNPEIGGPPIHTYQPAGVWAEPTFGNKKHQRSQGRALYRRSLYIFWRRIVGPTVFFDNATRQTCMVKTLQTNTPLHSLLTFNETTYVESARTLAEHLIEDFGDDEVRICQAFRRILCRKPSPDELAVFLNGLQRSRQEYSTNTEAALELVSVGDSKRNESLKTIEHAAWTSVSLAVLNLDETLTRE